MNSEVYMKEWWDWWKACQPKWRTCRPDGALDRSHTQGDWTALRVSGTNGLLIILLSLALWGVENPTGGWASWYSAIDDVHWVLQNSE
jgi:hypothetical protein